MSKQIRLADYVVDFVAKLGIRHIFLVPGGGAMHLNDALAKSPDITFIPNHHEQASVIAAEAYARINGRLGVAMLTTGPGSTNGITGVAGAWIESVPLLVISGQVKRADLIGKSGVRQKGVQGVDIVSIVKPITKYAVTVMEPDSIRYHLEQAIYLASNGRRGPVWLDIPLDVQSASIDVETLRGYSPEPEPPSDISNQADATIALINQAKRPIILAGHGVRLAGAAGSFAQLYESLQIPVVTTWNAMDLIAADHPLSVGRPGNVAQRPPNFAVQNSDLLIAIGARLDNIVTAYAPQNFAREARKVIVDIDQNELAKFSMPIEQSICADAAQFIKAMLQRLKTVEKIDRSSWIDTCHKWKQRYPAGGKEALPEKGPISHAHLIKVLSQEIPEDTLIVTGSSGLAVEFFYIVFQPKSAQRIFLTSGLGAMGYGLPAMIGAGLATSGTGFIGIEGDGSLQMNVQELSTIAALKLPVRIFIMNNNGYASIRTTQRNYFEGRYIASGPESGLHMPDIVALSEVMGIPAIRITDASELLEKVKYTLAQPGPFICDVQLIPDEALYPRCMAMTQSDGSLASMPLEDMSPLLPREELRENMIVELDPVSKNVVLP